MPLDEPVVNLNNYEVIEVLDDCPMKIQMSSEMVEKIDSMLLPIGFVKSMVADTIYYCKGICKFVVIKLWKVRKDYFFYVKLYSKSCADEDIIYLIANNNRSEYLYKNFSLDEILNILTTCKDVNKLDMYMANRENLKALEVLACR